MTNLQETIDSIADGLYKTEIIDKKTLRQLKESELPELNEFTGEDIKDLRLKKKLSQAVFAKYLNISTVMVQSLEQGKRKASGAILKLLNIIDKKGLKALS